MDEPRKSDEAQGPLNQDLHLQILLKLIFEIAPLGLAVVKSPDLVFHMVNPTYQDYLPVADVDPLDQRYEDVWPPDDGFEENALIQNVIETGEALDLDDHELRYPDGNARHFELHLRRWLWAEDPAVLIIISDNSESARAQEQMEEMRRSREAELEAAVMECLEDMLERQRYLFEIVEAERKLFSELLHGGPVQDLYAVLFQLRSLAGSAEARQVAGALGSISTKIAAVNQLLQQSYLELRPPSLDSFGLASAIKGHISSLRQSHPQIEFQVDLVRAERMLPESQRVALFRIYEAGMDNVLRHSGAKRVAVGLSINDDIVLEIQDDGQGFKVPDSWKEFAYNGRYGLLRSAERARSLGGRLEVVSEPGGGTRLRAHLPRSVGE